MGTAAVVGEGSVSLCRDEVTGGHSRNTRALVDCLVYQMEKQAQGDVGMGDALVRWGVVSRPGLSPHFCVAWAPFP